MKAVRQEDCYDLTNEELMDRFYEGDVEAFGILADRLRPSLMGQAIGHLPRHLAGRRELAEDCVQQTMIKAVITKNRKEIHWQPARGKVSTWIGTILRNTITSYLRSRQSKIPVSSDLSEPVGDSSQRPENRIVDYRLQAERNRRDQEHRCARWREIVNKLPQETGSMVRLQLQGKSHREISKQLGVARSTVTYRIKTATARLRNMAVA